MVFPLIKEVERQTHAATRVGVAASQHEVRPGVPLAMHHSRDTAHKQWSETRVLTLELLGRLLRTATSREGLVDSEWFEAVWESTLGLARDATLTGSIEQEVALAGVQLLVTMVQLASAAGFGRDEISYSTGMQVVDGALVAVQGSPTSKRKGREHKVP